MTFLTHIGMERRALLMGTMAMVFGSTVFADTLPSPTGAPLLTVRGEITNVSFEDQAQFDFALLSELPSETIETSTIWTEGLQEFKGVSLATLLSHVGANGRELRLRALNDYMISIPASDARADGPIIAYEHNGNQMSVRNKGPLWLVYPYDASPSYQTEEIYARSIWQLVEIEVLP